MPESVPIWRRLFPLLLLILVVIVAAVVNVLYKQQGAALSKPTALCVNNAPCIDSNGVPVVKTYNTTFTDALVISAHFVTIDQVAEKVSYRLTVDGIGKYEGNLGNITLVAGDSYKTFDGTTTTVGLDVSFGATDGDVSSFPFDIHAGSSTVTAFVGKPPAANGTFIPLGFQNMGTTGSFTSVALILGVDNTPGVYAYQIGVAVGRSSATKFFAIFTAFLQWVITLGYGFITVDIRFRGRKLEFPILAMGPGLLFAMPGIRNAAPNAPPIGTQLDMASLFFALAVIGLCLCANIFRYLWEAGIPPSTPAAAASSASSSAATLTTSKPPLGYASVRAQSEVWGTDHRFKGGAEEERYEPRYRS
ncbi:hypothetical protein M427DRAFT_73884 [Gonapodya prolifera JEL478]|uniref:Uncharacterized protein n=1 Tax=Gonapodya prolifera (strain JEL478) TaxID=1344416 RepID=A0A139A282_GONPJ|nr:hypothetical protein M427DRAFT_73884 [Gonapodya prolifera JEL478]|eukprot:KXS10463.1 hypothetical protein M427DRAFT_73884 [Gonapodya prolifera JEL478]